MLETAIRNARIVTPAGIVEGDLGIREGRIDTIGQAGPARHEIDAAGRFLCPGGVDPHCHIEQMSGMGQMNADTWETATRSAAMGGTTTVISFAAQAKGQPLAAAMADYAARAKRGAAIDHAFHAIIADTSVADFQSDLARQIAAGHRSLKLFTTYNIGLDDGQILSAMAAARAHGALVCIHAENDAIIARSRAALLAEGRLAPRDHAASRPPLAEIEAVERMCRFAEHVDTQIMLFHISAAGAVEAVAAARARGAPVWAETCPHYLFQTEEILSRPHGAKWMCSPPQRTEADQAALWRALLSGGLDLVSSDHAPYRHDETGKLSAGPQAGFHQIANGMPGLEPRLPLMFDAMVSRGQGGIEAFVQLTSTAAADLYGLPGKGRIEAGYDADLVIWDAGRSVTYGANDLHDNVGYNPWEGTTVTGWPDTVLLRGQIIAQNGAFEGRFGAGRWLSRQAPAAAEREDG